MSKNTKWVLGMVFFICATVGNEAAQLFGDGTAHRIITLLGLIGTAATAYMTQHPWNDSSK